jgi:hypothetical protein
MKNQLKKKLKLLKERYGSDAKAALALGITPVWFCAIKNGRRSPGKHLAQIIDLMVKEK